MAEISTQLTSTQVAMLASGWLDKKTYNDVRRAQDELEILKLRIKDKTDIDDEQSYAFDKLIKWGKNITYFA